MVHVSTLARPHTPQRRGKRALSTCFLPSVLHIWRHLFRNSTFQATKHVLSERGADVSATVRGLTVPCVSVLHAAEAADHPGAAGRQAGLDGAVLREPHGRHRPDAAHQKQGQVRVTPGLSVWVSSLRALCYVLGFWRVPWKGGAKSNRFICTNSIVPMFRFFAPS